MQERFKTCPKCGEVKPLFSFSNDKYKKSGKASRCKDCKYKWNAENPGRASALTRAWQVRNPEKVKAIRDKGKEKTANKLKEGRKNLHDWYIAKTISALMPERICISQIPPELIQAKRLQILVQRKLKELKK